MKLKTGSFDKYCVLAFIILIIGSVIIATLGPGKVTDKKKDDLGYYIQVNNDGYWNEINGDEYYSIKIGDSTINNNTSTVLLIMIMAISFTLLIGFMEQDRYRFR